MSHNSLRLEDPDDTYISSKDIHSTIQELADYYNHLYKEVDSITTLTVLEGAKPFAEALIPLLAPNAISDQIKVSSMNGTTSTGTITLDTAPKTSLEDRDVLIIEDLVDTGLTLSWLARYIKNTHRANSVHIVSLLEKPESRDPKADIPNLMSGIRIANAFVVGFGMDWNEKYRELPYVTIAHETKPGFWEPMYSEAA